MTRRLTALLLALSLGAFCGGCAQLPASLDDHQVLAKTSIELAVGQVIQSNPSAGRPIELAANALRTLVEGGDIATADEAATWAGQAVHWERLSAQDKILVENLLEVARTEATRLVENRTPKEVRARLAGVLGWIAEAAQAKS
jgi:hypothetical protein